MDPLTDVGDKILVVLDSFPRGKLTFVFTFPVLDLGIWIVDSKATVLLWGVATYWFIVRLGSLELIGEEGALAISLPLLQVAAYDLFVDV
nr:hypothetical protein [Tanacetum cinerariifolium]